MKNPYADLEIDVDADDEAIKEAYLAKVRAFPPESHPQRFQDIRAAFETLQSERKRIHHRLFQFRKDPPDFAELAAAITDGAKPGRPDRGHFQALLAESSHHFGQQED